MNEEAPSTEPNTHFVDVTDTGIREVDGLFVHSTAPPEKSVYNLASGQLAEHTDEAHAARPLSERAEILLGLRPWPKSPPSP